MTRHRAAMIGTLLAIATFSPGFSETASSQGAYRIVNENSGMALMPARGSKAWGTPLFQRPVSSHRSQLWDWKYEGNGRFSFRNLASNLCIHPSEWSRTATGAYLALGRCNTSNGARMWDLSYYGPVATGWQYTFRSRKSGLNMDVEESSTLTNALVIQARSDGTSSQKWRLEWVDLR
jgi:hypothetical protein